MLTIQLDMLQTAALAMILFLIGRFTVSHVAFFQRCCIPAPVIGGLIFAILHLVTYQTGVLTFTFDETLKTAFMDFFFTSVGFGASIKLLKKGAWPVILFLILATILVTIQNLVGVGLSGLFDLDGRLGLCMSSIPLVGGHGTSASFGPLFEGMGVEGATTVAVACATYGLVAGSLMGGPLGRWKIKKYNLKPLVTEESADLMGKELPLKAIDVAGNTSLNVFLGIALMTLMLWQLAALAVPIVVILAVQTVVMDLYASFVVFRAMGKDYEAAVMTAAICGFGMGATPNAMANMLAIKNQYGPAPKAFFVVPLVGGMFIDFTNSAIITVFTNLLS